MPDQGGYSLGVLTPRPEDCFIPHQSEEGEVEWPPFDVIDYSDQSVNIREFSFIMHKEDI